LGEFNEERESTAASSLEFHQSGNGVLDFSGSVSLLGFDEFSDMGRDSLSDVTTVLVGVFSGETIGVLARLQRLLNEVSNLLPVGDSVLISELLDSEREGSDSDLASVGSGGLEDDISSVVGGGGVSSVGIVLVGDALVPELLSL
jgi:hypothetical protein